MITYKVAKGDTLSKIAGQYGVSIQAIVTANGIKNANLIRVGQSLLIPAKAAPVDDLSEINVTAKKIGAAPGTGNTPPSPGIDTGQVLEETVVRGARQIQTAGLNLSEWLRPPKLFYLLAAVAGAAYLATTGKRRR